MQKSYLTSAPTYSYVRLLPGIPYSLFNYAVGLTTIPLATFAADRIVIFSHPEGDRDYREDESLADAETRWNLPVTHALISR